MYALARDEMSLIRAIREELYFFFIFRFRFRDAKIRVDLITLSIITEERHPIVLTDICRDYY